VRDYYLREQRIRDIEGSRTMFRHLQVPGEACEDNKYDEEETIDMEEAGEDDTALKRYTQCICSIEYNVINII